MDPCCRFVKPQKKQTPTGHEASPLLDLSRSVERRQSDLCPPQHGGFKNPAETEGEARTTGLHLLRETGGTGQHKSTAERLEKSWNQRLPLARPPAHVGLMAYAVGNAFACLAGIGGMCRLQDGPKIRSSGPGAPDTIRGKLESRHKYVTTGIEDRLKVVEGTRVELVAFRVRS